MKGFWVGLLVLLFMQIRASDTLTRGQVYSFSIGDTFDYCHYNLQWDHGHVYGPTISYFRKVITNIYYSPDSSTKYIERTSIYPLPVQRDTLPLTNLQQCEVCLDTSNYYEPDVLSFFSTSAYDRIVNIILTHRGGPPYPYPRTFAEGLGEVMDIDNGSYLGGQVGDIDTFQLIYYAGGSSKWGSPYYTFPTGVGNLSNSETIIYPTSNDGRFRLATGMDKPPVEFWVYDILGKVVLHEIIAATNTAIDIQQYGQGVYIWTLTEQGKIASSGKIVVQ